MIRNWVIVVSWLGFVTMPLEGLAWGKRGHSIVCQTAAGLTSRETSGEFLESHSFDLGYYCNIPDLAWKKPKSYVAEANQHFMDMEIFERELKKSAIKNAYELDRVSFEKSFPKVPLKAGRAWWRVRELEDSLTKITTELKEAKLAKAKRHDKQLEWLVLSGVIGHYIGDLSQPLHVTENYDGQLTGQKGIHSFFESRLVDFLFHAKDAKLEAEVQAEAEVKWLKGKDLRAGKSTLELLQSLTAEANSSLSLLLNRDKKTGRSDLKKAGLAHREMIIDQMASGAVTLAEVYRRQLGWKYDGDKFYTFDYEPEFIAPPTAIVSPSPSPSPKAAGKPAQSTPD